MRNLRMNKTVWTPGLLKFRYYLKKMKLMVKIFNHYAKICEGNIGEKK
jgi:hypothetical protein